MEETKKLTIQDIEKIWTEFVKRADQAEQYQFPMIAYYHMRMEPLVKDLMINWDDHHADIFIQYMSMVYKRLGWEATDV